MERKSEYAQGLRLIMKGNRKPVFFGTESIEQSIGMMTDLFHHVEKHGPNGWLLTHGLYLNVAEIQAAHATGIK